MPAQYRFRTSDRRETERRPARSRTKKITWAGNLIPRRRLKGGWQVNPAERRRQVNSPKAEGLLRIHPTSRITTTRRKLAESPSTSVRQPRVERQQTSLAPARPSVFVRNASVRTRKEVGRQNRRKRSSNKPESGETKWADLLQGEESAYLLRVIRRLVDSLPEPIALPGSYQTATQEPLPDPKHSVGSELGHKQKANQGSPVSNDKTVEGLLGTLRRRVAGLPAGGHMWVHNFTKAADRATARRWINLLRSMGFKVRTGRVLAGLLEVFVNKDLTPVQADDIEIVSCVLDQVYARLTKAQQEG